MNDDLRTRILTNLSHVEEPRTGLDVVELGMVDDIAIQGDGTVTLTIALPLPGYDPRVLEQGLIESVLLIDGINAVDVTYNKLIPANPAVQGRMNLNVKSLIAVSSGKGGVGKSTIATNIAVALAQMGARTGLLDADILGPNIPTMLGIDRMPAPDGQRLNPAEAFGIKVVSMGFLIDPDKPLIWRGPMVHSAIRQFFTDVEWGELDYIVIDLPPGTGDAQLTLAQSVPLTGAIVVTQPQDVAVSDALRGLGMFRHVEVPIIGVVENMSGDFFGKGGGEALAEKTSVPFLGRIPLDSEVRRGGDSGNPAVAVAPESPAAVALSRVALHVAARVNKIARYESGDMIPLTTIE